jgi:NDP-sugar pyrophosphorylase family protein
MFNHELLILCGGRGSRLSSVWRRPKILAPIGNSTYLEILLGILAETSCNFNLTLATGYKSQDVEDQINELGLDVSILREESELGTGGAVTNFLKEHQPKRFSVLNGDTLFSERDLHSFFHRTLQTSACLIATQKVDSNDRFGSVDITPNLSIQKPTLPLKRDLVYAGLGTFVTTLMCKELEAPFSLEKLINLSEINETNVELFILNSGFYDIGTPESLAKASIWLQKN